MNPSFARPVDRILVIKLGALGDFILAMGPFAAIRKHHADSRVTLLTTGPFVALAEMSGYFDEVWVDTRPGVLQIGAWWGLRRRLRAAGFRRVYDLQTSDRSGMYFRLFGRARRPEWSGIAPGCSHPHANPRRDDMHSIERQKEQLAMAGIADLPAPDLSWLDADLTRFDLPERFALLVPGGAPHRPEKRWPGESYGDLAGRLQARGIRPVVIGTAKETPVLETIARLCPEAVNLADRTDLADIAGLARRALLAVGNDTGPMHLLAAVGRPSLVLFSGASNPELSAPRGPAVELLRVARLNELSVERVEGALAPWFERVASSDGRP